MTTRMRAVALLFLAGIAACESNPIIPKVDPTISGKVYGDILGSAASSIAGTSVTVSSGSTVNSTHLLPDGSFTVVRNEDSPTLNVFMEGGDQFHPSRLIGIEAGNSGANVKFPAIPRFYAPHSGTSAGQTVEIDLEACYTKAGNGDNSAFCHWQELDDPPASLPDHLRKEWYKSFEPVTPRSLPMGLRFASGFEPTDEELTALEMHMDSLNAQHGEQWFSPYKEGMVEVVLTRISGPRSDALPRLSADGHYVTSCVVRLGTENGVSDIHDALTVAHELGHCLGLGHRPVTDEVVDDWKSVMGTSSFGPGDTRYFSKHDIAYLHLFREIGMLRQKHQFEGGIHSAYLGTK